MYENQNYSSHSYKKVSFISFHSILSHINNQITCHFVNLAGKFWIICPLQNITNDFKALKKTNKLNIFLSVPSPNKIKSVKVLILLTAEYNELNLIFWIFFVPNKLWCFLATNHGKQIFEKVSYTSKMTCSCFFFSKVQQKFK